MKIWLEITTRRQAECLTSDKARTASVLNGSVKNDPSYEFIGEVIFLRDQSLFMAGGGTEEKYFSW
jgi:hypothetical protein